jgi:hypothetical protein
MAAKHPPEQEPQRQSIRPNDHDDKASAKYNAAKHPREGRGPTHTQQQLREGGAQSDVGGKASAQAQAAKHPLRRTNDCGHINHLASRTKTKIS